MESVKRVDASSVHLKPGPAYGQDMPPSSSLRQEKSGAAVVFDDCQWEWEEDVREMVLLVCQCVERVEL